MTPPHPETATPLVDFAGLYREQAPDVHRFALYLSGDPSLADDLVSEAFVRVWTARERVELTTVRGYLFAIVRNLFLQHLRRERRRGPLDERIADDRPDPEVRASDQSRLRAVLAALSTLPEIDRAAVLMRADEALPYEEIAAALRISVAAAKGKVHRARMKLAEALQPGGRRERNP
jgi:RNA polymerase sigma-70 factor (ECF subfamily)